MNICLVNSEYPAGVVTGGIAAYTTAAANALVQAGCHVHVIIKKGVVPEGLDDSVVLHEVQPQKLPVFWVRNLLYRFFWVLNQHLEYGYGVYLKVLELYKQKNITLAEIPDYNGEAFFLILKRVLPICIKLHTPSFLVSRINGVSPNLKDWIVKQLESYCIKHATCLISPSRSLAESVSQDLHLKREIGIIPYPIQGKNVRAHHSENKNMIHIVYIGRLEVRKGITLLFNVIPLIFEKGIMVKFHFVGQNMIQHRKEYEKLLYFLETHPSLKDSVNWVGPVNKDVLEEYFILADIFVMPSLYENFPNSLLEAMAAGCAVLAARNGGMQEIIQDHENGLLFQTNDEQDLYLKLMTLIEQPSLRDLLGSNAKRTIQDRYSYQMFAKRTIETYTKIFQS